MAHGSPGTILTTWEISTVVIFLVPGVNTVRWAPSRSGISIEQVFTGWTTFRITQVVTVGVDQLGSLTELPLDGVVHDPVSLNWFDIVHASVDVNPVSELVSASIIAPIGSFGFRGMVVIGSLEGFLFLTVIVDGADNEEGSHGEPDKLFFSRRGLLDKGISL